MLPYYQASRADQSFFGSARPMFAYQKATNVAPLRGDFESANSEFTLN
jgi:hypothetical protein